MGRDACSQITFSFAQFGYRWLLLFLRFLQVRKRASLRLRKGVCQRYQYYQDRPTGRKAYQPKVGRPSKRSPLKVPAIVLGVLPVGLSNREPEKVWISPSGRVRVKLICPLGSFHV